MTFEEVKNLGIELAELEAKVAKYRGSLGFAYSELNQNKIIEMERDIPIHEHKIKEIREKLETTTIE